MKEKLLVITREKHLDHLVRVTPLVVLGYALQCYILFQLKGAFAPEFIMILGLALVTMIGCFILYDTKHRVKFSAEYLSISFLFYHKVIPLNEIKTVSIAGTHNSFDMVMLETHHHGKIRLYFVDDAFKIKEWIDSQKNSSRLAA
jgi:hypothetical protein